MIGPCTQPRISATQRRAQPLDLIQLIDHRIGQLSIGLDQCNVIHYHAAPIRLALSTTYLSPSSTLAS